jgi:hypothetical protein
MMIWRFEYQSLRGSIAHDWTTSDGDLRDGLVPPCPRPFLEAALAANKKAIDGTNR